MSILLVWLIAMQPPAPDSAETAKPVEAKESAQKPENLVETGTAKWIELKATIRVDPPPESLTRDQHHYNSDERRHDLFYDTSKNTGGMFVGVGTNQNYLIAGWSRPEYLIVVDFDQAIIDLHEVYRLAFLNAETPKEFHELWSYRGRKTIRQLIVKNFKVKQRRVEILTVHEEARRRTYAVLKRGCDMAREHQVTCFLEDEEQYNFLVQLFRDDRVFFVRGDFTGVKTMADIGRVAKKLDVPVRVLYLSNVEQYFGWRQRFRNNMLGLPFDEKSVVLRAYGFGPHRAADHNYRYFVQSGQLFHAWLKDENTRSVVRLLKSGEESKDAVGFYHLTKSPEEVPVLRKRTAKASAKAGKPSDEAAQAKAKSSDEAAQAKVAKSSKSSKSSDEAPQAKAGKSSKSSKSSDEAASDEVPQAKAGK